MSQGFSVLRVELERAQLSFSAMITQVMIERDEEVARAIQEALSPENVSLFIQREVNRAVESTIRDEVDHFYRYGKGKAIVRELVAKQLGDPA